MGQWARELAIPSIRIRVQIPGPTLIKAQGGLAYIYNPRAMRWVVRKVDCRGLVTPV